MLIAVDAVVALVLTAKVPLVAPAGIVTEGGVVASVVLLLASEIMAPPEEAGALSVTLPVDGDPPVTLLGFRVSEVRVGPGAGGGVTVREAVCFWDTPA